MSTPGFTSEAALYESIGLYYVNARRGAANAGTAAVIPQLSACSPCIQVGGQQLCVTLFSRRICLRVPFIGRWRICCTLRFGWPPLSCGIQHC
jgi:hypothetical protein